jgi:hypothetical protein
VLVDTVMGLAESNAWQAAGDQAEIDGLEAGKETGVPGDGVFRRLGVDDVAGLGEDSVESLSPSLDVPVVNGTAASLGRSRHDD